MLRININNLKNKTKLEKNIIYSPFCQTTVWADELNRLASIFIFMNKEDVSGLAGLFSGSIANILDFLLIHKGFDYSKTEIAENAGVGYKTLFDNWDKL